MRLWLFGWWKKLDAKDRERERLMNQRGQVVDYGLVLLPGQAIDVEIQFPDVPYNVPYPGVSDDKPEERGEVG